VTGISNAELCARAEAVLNPQKLGELWVADVACALVAADGRIFTGTCIGGYLGLCAEQSAVSSMVSAGPPTISRLVAVWRDPDGDLHALPPCGRCREFLRVLSQDNLDADVILGPSSVVKLRDLLPSYGWSSQLLWKARPGPDMARRGARPSDSGGPLT
jgi:cytidine deaminase